MGSLYALWTLRVSRLSFVKICGKSKDDKGGLEVYGRVLRQLTDIDKIYLFMNTSVE
jgi:hypothetical protein